MLPKITGFVKLLIPDLLLSLVIIVITIISFDLGKLAERKSEEQLIHISKPDGTTGKMNLNGQSETDQIGVNESTEEQVILKEIEVIVSKSSKTGVYHFPWCSGASRISEKNKKVFPSEQSAIDAGYRLAGNCNR